MYNTIMQNSSFELTEKKSKFIANLIYIESKEQAQNVIKDFKKKYHDARHNCYAYRVIEEDSIYEKSSDDGEPSGTAGGPILNILQKNDLCNVLVIVTRYFGGILLGTGGLVRCYSNSTIGALEKSEITEIVQGVQYLIQIDYSNFENLKRFFNKNNISILKIDYNELITCQVQMDLDIKENFLKEVNNLEIDINNIKYLKEIFIKKVSKKLY